MTLRLGIRLRWGCPLIQGCIGMEGWQGGVTPVIRFHPSRPDHHHPISLNYLFLIVDRVILPRSLINGLENLHSLEG